jgi:hypothetical protein
MDCSCRFSLIQHSNSSCERTDGSCLIAGRASLQEKKRFHAVGWIHLLESLSKTKSHFHIFNIEIRFLGEYCANTRKIASSDSSSAVLSELHHWFWKSSMNAVCLRSRKKKICAFAVFGGGDDNSILTFLQSFYDWHQLTNFISSEDLSFRN